MKDGSQDMSIHEFCAQYHNMSRLEIQKMITQKLYYSMCTLVYVVMVGGHMF